jgi:hypothetical protein
LSKFQSGIIAIVFFAFLSGIFMFRFAVVPGGVGGEGVHGVVYRLDRWTGAVMWISGSVSGNVEKAK